MGRRYGARESEHMTEVEATKEKKFTRSRKKEAETETHKSALADHTSQTNHMIAWDKVSLPSKDVNWKACGVREAIAIRRSGGEALNRDGGRHRLPNVYDDLLAAAPPGGHRQH